MYFKLDVGAAASSGVALAEPEVKVNESIENPWVVIVWDDPVNLMPYVTYVFQKLFRYSRKKAHELMMQVHTEGKAVVASGSHERVEAAVRKLHTAGLWATMQQDA